MCQENGSGYPGRAKSQGPKLHGAGRQGAREAITYI